MERKTLKPLRDAELQDAYNRGFKQGSFEEKERIMRIFASFGKIQLSKPLSGKEFEALFD